MKKQNGIKLVSLLSAVTVMTTTLAGCGLFDRSSDSKNEDTQQAENDIILDVPKPNDYDLDDDLEDDSEQLAEQDTESPKEDDLDETENTVEEVKPQKEADFSQNTDRFVNSIDFQSVFNEPKQNKVTTSVLAPESVNRPEQYKNAVYEPVGAVPAAPKAVEVLAKPTAALPKPSTKAKYKNARFQEPGLYNEPRTYHDGTVVAGNVTIIDKVFTGNLTIDVSKGTVTLKNVKIGGSLILKGGPDWVKLYDVTAEQLLVDSTDPSKVFVSRSSGLNGVLVKSDVLLEEGGLYTNARGVSNVVVNAPKGTKVNLQNLRLNQITTKTACDIVNDSSSIINHVYAEAPTELYGSGQINRLYCESNGVYYDTRPLYIETARGYAPPSRRSSSGGSSGGNTQDKKVTLHSIPDQYLDIGSVRYVGIDHNGSSLRVTTTNSSIAKVTYSTSKSRITMQGVKPGSAVIKITSSRAGYQSSTISFKLVVKGSSQGSIQLSPIRDQSMDVDDFRYLTVNTDASRIEVSNSNSSVLQVGTNGFQLSLYAKRAGYSDVKVTAYRSGRTAKSTTFRVNVYEPHHQDSVTIQRIDDQILNNGDSRYINVRTDASSISASSSNEKVARVTTYRDNTIRVDSVAPGTAWISVVGKRSGMQNSIEVFRVDVNADRISAPYVNVHYANGVPYQNATWSNQDVIFDLSGYTSNRTAYSYERPFGSSSNDWGNRRELPKGTLTVKEEGQKDYYFFTKDNNTVSEASSIYTVWIDKTLPSLTVNNNTDTTLNFTVSDARSGVAQVTVTNQDTKEVVSVLPNEKGVCSFTASKQGKYSITVMDKAGNRVSSSAYTLNGPTAPDTQKPEITVVNESQYANWFAKSQEVVFKVSDNSGAVASVTVAPSVVLTRNEDGSYVFSANYEGEQTYTITALDESGNKQTKEIKVKVDKTAPNVEDIAISPVAGTDTQKVTFRVTENGSGIKEVNVSPMTNPNTKQVVAKEEKGYSFIGSNNTSYYITVTDNAGNVSLQKEITLKSETPTPPTPPTTVSKVEIHNVSVENPNDITRSKNVKVEVKAELTDKQTLTVNLIAPSKLMAKRAPNLTAIQNTYLFTAEENGTYQVEAIIKEGDRVITTSTSSVTVSNLDNKAPVVLVTKNENSVVSFTVNDEHLKSVTFDGAVIAAVNGVYTKENLSAGEHLIYAVDAAGNETSQKVKVVRTPSVNVQNSNLQSTNNKDVTTTVQVDSYGEKIVSAQVDQSGATLTKESDNNYRFTATKNGTYRLTFTTEAGVSTQAEVSVNGIYATEFPPVITVGKLEINDTHTEVKVPIKVSDDHTAPAAIGVKVNKGKLSLGQADGEYFLTMTENGSVTVTAKDDKGNSSETTVAVDGITGNILPVIRLESITGDSTTAKVTLDISHNGGTEIVSVLDQQGHAAVADTNGKYVLTVSENGHYTVTAKNKAGKAVSVDFDVTQIDRTAPVIAAPAVTVNETLSQAAVSVQVSDDVNGVKGSGVMQVSLKGVPMQPTATGWQGTITENGTFEVMAQDNAGNVATASVTVSTLDKTAPEIVVTSKNDKWAKEQLVTFSVTDASSGVESVTVVKGATAVAVKEENGWKFTAVENGTYVITAKDRAGNQKTQNVVVTKVDKTAPAVPTLKDNATLIPANNAKTPYELKAKQVAVQFAKAKDGEAPVHLMIKKAGAEKFTAFDKTVIDLKDGENKLQLKTVDDAGNESAVTNWVIKVTNSASAASTKPETTEKPAEPEAQPVEEKTKNPKPASEKKAGDPVPTEN